MSRAGQTSKATYAVRETRARLACATLAVIGLLATGCPPVPTPPTPTIEAPAVFPETTIVAGTYAGVGTLTNMCEIAADSEFTLGTEVALAADGAVQIDGETIERGATLDGAGQVISISVAGDRLIVTLQLSAEANGVTLTGFTTYTYNPVDETTVRLTFAQSTSSTGGERCESGATIDLTR